MDSCSLNGKVCPGIAIGCGLCAIMQIDSCPVLCPVSAVYCGSSGYICAGGGGAAEEDAQEKK